MEYIGSIKTCRSTSMLKIDGVYTVEDYYNLRDELKSEMKKKNLAVFENMDIFAEAFNETTDPLRRPLHIRSMVWGIKINELTFDDGDFKLSYEQNRITKNTDLNDDNVFMFYTTKGLATGKRSRRRGKRSRRRGKK